MPSYSHAKYELLSPIGEGGMGEVFRGIAVGACGFCRPVAIKRIRAELAQDSRLGRWFRREALLCARLDHPNIVSVLDFSQAPDGHMLIVMELVDGANLGRFRHALSQAGLLPVPVALFIITELLRGLAHAHEHNIIHRDISPHNVLLARTGAVKLSDFGVARSSDMTETTSSHALRGKLRYLSPEQLHNWHVDHRADLFSVGVVLYELLTGCRPHASAETDAEYMAQVLLAPVPPPSDMRPDVSPELDQLTLRLLAKAREERFGSAGAVLDALDTLPGPRAGATQLAALIEQHIPRDQPPLEVPAAQAAPADDCEGAGHELAAPMNGRPGAACAPAGVPEVPEAAQQPVPLMMDVIFKPSSHAGLHPRPRFSIRLGVGVAAAAMLLGGLGAFLGMALMPEGNPTQRLQAPGEPPANSLPSSALGEAKHDAAQTPLTVHAPPELTSSSVIRMENAASAHEQAVHTHEQAGRVDASASRPAQRFDAHRHDDPAWPIRYGEIVQQ